MAPIKIFKILRQIEALQQKLQTLMNDNKAKAKDIQSLKSENVNLKKFRYVHSFFVLYKLQ